MPASTEVNLSPRVQEALRCWDAMPAQDRAYAKVAESMNVTTGRAAVYVRQALDAVGRSDETPRRRANGGGAPQVQTPEALMQQAAEQVRQQIALVQARADEAEQAATFDAEAWKAEQAAALKQQIKDLQARARAWETDTDNVATEAATVEEQRRTDRAATVKAQVDEQLAALQPTLDGYEKALAAISGK